MKRLIAIILLSVMICTVSACSTNKTNPLETIPTTQINNEATTQKTDYQTTVDKVVRQSNFSGVIYITKDGKVLCQSVSGKVNQENNKDITVDSLFCIGSISKQFVSTSVMLLKEQGKLSVDDKLEKYFPEYEYGKEITIQNLLTMRSGIIDHTAVEENGIRKVIPVDELGYSISDKNTAEKNRHSALEWIFSQPLKFEPNEMFEYTNTNYFLLAEIVEQVSEMKYEDFIKQNIFEPLGMKHSGFIEDLIDSSELAEENETDGSYLKVMKSGIVRGAGDIISNAKDMDLWLTALRENNIVSKESFEEMTQNYSPDGRAYGYGLMVNFNGGIGHIGMIASYTSFDYINISQKYNFFAVTNNYSALSDDISAISSKIISKTLK